MTHLVFLSSTFLLFFKDVFSVIISSTLKNTIQVLILTKIPEYLLSLSRIDIANTNLYDNNSSWIVQSFYTPFDLMLTLFPMFYPFHSSNNKAITCLTIRKISVPYVRTQGIRKSTTFHQKPSFLNQNKTKLAPSHKKVKFYFYFLSLGPSQALFLLPIA